MIYAIHFLAVLGSLVVAWVAIIGCAFAYDAFTDWMARPHAKSFYEGQQDVRNRLMGDAWWFSESPETQSLIHDLARGVGVSEARDKWRAMRAEREAS